MDTVLKREDGCVAEDEMESLTDSVVITVITGVCLSAEGGGSPLLSQLGDRQRSSRSPNLPQATNSPHCTSPRRTDCNDLRLDRQHGARARPKPIDGRSANRDPTYLFDCLQCIFSCRCALGCFKPGYLQPPLPSTYTGDSHRVAYPHLVSPSHIVPTKHRPVYSAIATSYRSLESRFEQQLIARTFFRKAQATSATRRLAQRPSPLSTRTAPLANPRTQPASCQTRRSATSTRPSLTRSSTARELISKRAASKSPCWRNCDR